MLARAIDAEWERHRRPDPWVVVEAGAADGALAAAVLGAGPRCRGALRYVCVEASPAARDAARSRLPVELPSLVLGPRTASHDLDGRSDDAGAGVGVGVEERGPLITVLGELPAEPFTGMVVANELLDNLAIDLLEWAGGQWMEVRVGEAGGRPVEVAVPASEEDVALAGRLAGDATPADRGRLPLQRAAAGWLAAALRLVGRGRVICVDYCAPRTASLVGRDWTEWLRTYRGHGRGGHPLDRPGSQDITCEVAVDQLARIRPPDADRAQADWLEAQGLAELVTAARAAWSAANAAASGPDLAALHARSRLSEAAALTDPAGLGGFRVLEWSR